jgi:hypothetical protein
VDLEEEKKEGSSNSMNHNHLFEERMDNSEDLVARPLIRNSKKKNHHILESDSEIQEMHSHNMCSHHHSKEKIMDENGEGRDTLRKRRLKKMQEKVENNRQSLAKLN